MFYRFDVKFPKAWEIYWRASGILKKRRPEAAFAAVARLRLLIDDFAEQRLQEEISDFISSHSNSLLERGGWELGYLPDRFRDSDGVYHVGRSDLAYLLENWPDRANLPDGYPTKKLSDVDVLSEVLCLPGWSIGYLPGFENISDAECFALLAQEKINMAQSTLVEGRTADNSSFVKWTGPAAIKASEYVTDAMECVCIAERHLWDDQLSKMSAERLQRQEVELRREIRKSLAQAAAKQRVAGDPKQVAKVQVRECWELWREHPERYKSKSAFARDMLAKFDDLESQRVIERWCKEWESELSR